MRDCSHRRGVSPRLPARHIARNCHGRRASRCCRTVAVGGLLPAGRHRPGGGRSRVVRNAYVGLGVLPTPLRNVVATAMEIATLEAMFPGRLRVGIGHGVQDWMRQGGAPAASPLTLMREYGGALAGR